MLRKPAIPILLAVLLGCFVYELVEKGFYRTEFIRDRIAGSVAVLVITKTGRSGSGACTCSVVRKTDRGYLVLTTGHCVDPLDTTLNYAVSFSGQPKDGIPATIKGYYTGGGLDYAVLEIATTQRHPVIPLGDERLSKPGDIVLSFEDMGDYGLQYEQGYVSRVGAVRTLESNMWPTDKVVFVWLPGQVGASGSPVVSVKQGAAIGIIVGELDGDANTVVVPISVLEEKLALDFPNVGDGAKTPPRKPDAAGESPHMDWP